MMNKKAYEFSFAWLFALFVGAAVIFFAIYFATQLIYSQQFTHQAKAAKDIEIILNPLETSLEQAKVSVIKTSEEITLFNECRKSSDFNPFGWQDISLSIPSKIGSPEVEGVQSSFKNKYIFSKTQLTAEDELYALSKPFFFPMKLADLIMLWPDSKKYCFVTPPNEIKKDIKDLNLEDKNIFNASSLSSCPDQSKKVCFPPISDPQCDVIVSSNTVYHKDYGDVFHVQTFGNNLALVYAAIFSDPEIYECHLNRLMSRAAELSELQIDKSIYLEPKGCGGSTLVRASLTSYKNALGDYESSSDLADFTDKAQDVNEKNENLFPCALF